MHVSAKFGKSCKLYRLYGVRCALLAVLALFVLPCSTADQAIDPFDGRPDLYHADLTRYFSSAEAESDARSSLIASTDAYLHTAPWSADGAAARLDEGSRLVTEWMRHRIYCKARNSRDSTDKPAKLCENAAAERYGIVLSFAEAQLQGKAMRELSDVDIERFDLNRYHALLQQARDNATHALSPDAEHVADVLADAQRDSLYDRYSATLRNMKAATLVAPGGKLDPIKDAARIAHNPDRALRRAGFEARQQAYAAHGELLAATLIDIAREETALAKLRGFPSAPARKYASSLQLTEPQVRATLAAMTQHAQVLKDYQQVRAEQVAQVTGIADVHSWDMALSSGFTPSPLPFAQAKSTILKALAPLGADYVAQFAWLLDPSNGALEIAGGPNRYRGGFSLGYSGVPVMLYVDDFDASIDKTSVVIHEGGHAIHRKLMNEVSPYYANGPKFLFEAYAILNQLLLWDELEREAATPTEKNYYQERFLDTVSLEVFTSAEEATLEQELYEGVAAGTINNQADLDQLNARILDKYEWLAPQEPDLRSEWMKKKLLFEDPLYLVNYLYAALVACKLYEMDLANPADFQKHYLDLLREGFDAPAATLLEKNMGIALDSDQLLDGALKLMQDRTTHLQASYAPMRQ